MQDKEVYRKLGFLVGTAEAWDGLLAYIDAVEEETQYVLNTADSPTVMYRMQGKLRFLKELRNLKATMKIELRS